MSPWMAWRIKQGETSMDFIAHCYPKTSDLGLHRIGKDVWLVIGNFRVYVSGIQRWVDRIDDALAARLIEAIEPGTTMPEISA